MESANPEAQKLVSVPTPEHLQNRNTVANHSGAFMKLLTLWLLRGQGSRGTTISRSSVSRRVEGLNIERCRKIQATVLKTTTASGSGHQYLKDITTLSLIWLEVILLAPTGVRCRSGVEDLPCIGLLSKCKWPENMKLT